MGIIPERKEYKNFTYEQYSLFTQKVQSLGYTKVTHTPHSSKSHLDRYGYLDKGNKVAVVYDLKAKMLTLTAPDKSIKALNGIIKQLDGNDKKRKVDETEKNINSSKNKAKQGKDKTLKEKVEQPIQPSKDKTSRVTGGKKEKTKRDQGFFSKKAEKEQSKAEKKKAKEKKHTNAQKVEKNQSLAKEKQKEGVKKIEQPQKPIAKPQKSVVEGAQGAFALISGYYPLSFTKAMHKIRNTQDMKINTLPTINLRKENETANYIIVKGGKNSEVRYMSNLGKLEIYGELTSVLKSEFLKFGGNETASNDIQQESKYEKVLSKFMPTALQYLTVQEINDIGSGYEELKKASEHYEYSMFLLSPFKGLENFIFDLQKRLGISVKLLGQAYDKDKYGNYMLK